MMVDSYPIELLLERIKNMRKDKTMTQEEVEIWEAMLKGWIETQKKKVKTK